jgi:HlyD family secretion protein
MMFNQRRRSQLISFSVCTVVLAAGCSSEARQGTAAEPAVAIGPVDPAPRPTTLRLTGTVEAVRFQTVAVPRLAGAALNALLITKLAKGGTRVEPGDVIAQFDQQQQLTAALDRAADVVDLDGQIKRRMAEQAATRERDNTEIMQAENDEARAKLDNRRNEFLGQTDAEKNRLALEQATARLKQLRETYDLKRKAAAADLRILEIRKERAERNRTQAEKNAELMEIRAPFAGLVVIRTNFRGSAGFVEVQEGDELRPGLPIVSLVDTSAMQVRARVNQADIGAIRSGQAAKIRLDGFPELLFDGVVDLVAPLAVPSEMSLTVKTFSAVISIKGSHEQLLPDLTASVEILPASGPAVTAKAGGK